MHMLILPRIKIITLCVKSILILLLKKFRRKGETKMVNTDKYQLRIIYLKYNIFSLFYFWRI